MILKIVLKNIVHKKLNSFLCVLLMMFGVAIISLLINVGKQLEKNFTKNISGIDMVVGAKGSPLQLILSSIFHIDSPTGNISINEIEKLANNPLVKTIIPISVGDNYEGFRIIGTNKLFYEHYNLEANSGSLQLKNMEVLVGYSVAIKKKLKIGDKFQSAHGLDSEGEKHANQEFIVKGILKANNSVVDNLILCSLSSIWEIHEHHDTEANENEAHNKEITCALVKFRSPMGMMTIPRNINSNTTMQAALPAIEINRLLELFGKAIEVLNILAFAIIIISGLSVFVTLFNALKERKHEMALMLTLGASRTKIFIMLVSEGLILSFLGYAFGVIISRLLIILFSGNNLETNNYGVVVQSIQKEEIFLLIGALLVGIFAAAIPSSNIYKIDIAETLAEE